MRSWYTWTKHFAIWSSHPPPHILLPLSLDQASATTLQGNVTAFAPWNVHQSVVMTSTYETSDTMLTGRTHLMITRSCDGALPPHRFHISRHPFALLSLCLLTYKNRIPSPKLNVILIGEKPCKKSINPFSKTIPRSLFHHHRFKMWLVASEFFKSNDMLMVPLIAIKPSRLPKALLYTKGLIM